MREPIIPVEVGNIDPESLLDEADPVTAWEEIDIGRYMPRRIRGSYRGGQLG
jgi:hypothetical protein